MSRRIATRHGRTTTTARALSRHPLRRRRQVPVLVARIVGVSITEHHDQAILDLVNVPQLPGRCQHSSALVLAETSALEHLPGEGLVAHNRVLVRLLILDLETEQLGQVLLHGHVAAATKPLVLRRVVVVLLMSLFEVAPVQDIVELGETSTTRLLQLVQGDVPRQVLRFTNQGHGSHHRELSGRQVRDESGRLDALLPIFVDRRVARASELLDAQS